MYFFLIDLNTYSNEINQVSINKVEQKQSQDKANVLPFNENLELSFKQNSITFNYSTPIYDKYRTVEYQYQLEPYLEKWSSWSKNSSVSFDKLPYGNYTFKVKSRTSKNTYSDTDAFSFTINKQWSLSTPAFAIYVLLILLLIFVTSYCSRRF